MAESLKTDELTVNQFMKYEDEKPPGKSQNEKLVCTKNTVQLLQQNALEDGKR